MVWDWQVLLPFNPCYDDECEVSELKFAYISKKLSLIGHEHEKRNFVLRTSGLQSRVGRRHFFFLVAKTTPLKSTKI